MRSTPLSFVYTLVNEKNLQSKFERVSKIEVLNVMEDSSEIYGINTLSTL